MIAHTATAKKETGSVKIATPKLDHEDASGADGRRAAMSARAVGTAAAAAAAFGLVSWLFRRGDEPEDDPIVESLRALGQQHLFAKWAPRKQEVGAKRAMLAQLRLLDANYPGGLAAYIRSARQLLRLAQRGENALAGWVPSVPSDGHHLEPGTEAFAG
jgi:hypothetical protein